MSFLGLEVLYNSFVELTVEVLIEVEKNNIH